MEFGQWINVNEKLPELAERVLVILDNGFTILIGRLHTNGWSVFYSDGEQLVGEPKNCSQVTHWTPLPKVESLVNQPSKVENQVLPKIVEALPPIKSEKTKDFDWLENELESILFEMEDGNATKEQTKNKLYEVIFDNLVNEIQKLRDSSLSV